MLREVLAGSYKRYKQDIALFVTWLAKAASSVGYVPNGTKHRQSQQPEPLAAEPKGAQVKGKARKAAKDAAGKAEEPCVDTSESQAPSTSYLKFDVKMPASLRVVVERAVRARQRCSEWFQESGMEETPEVDPTEVPEVATTINTPAKTKASEGFFEDLHRTQEFINDLWRKYKAKKCDLRTAAVTTNGAFDLVR
ncbi:MAG: hypothetical protein Q9199_002582 [Rusavskia elegans]